MVDGSKLRTIHFIYMPENKCNDNSDMSYKDVFINRLFFHTLK